MLQIPKIVQEKARVEGVSSWIDSLPAVVEQVAAEWNLTVGAVLTGGTESLVIETTTESGDLAVLKLVVPRRQYARDEAAALRLADGRGAARLLAFDGYYQALLVERLGAPMHVLGIAAHDRHQLLAETAQAFWRPIEPGLLRSGANQAAWLNEFIERRWNELDHPCGRAAVDLALTCADRRAAAHDDDRAVMVHGDVHQWNTLQRGDGWALIDPDGLFAEPAYDLGIIMREDPEEMLTGDPRDRSRRLAALTGVDETAI